MSWLQKLLAAAHQGDAGRRARRRCPRACGSSVRRAKPCSIAPISRRTSTSARSATITSALSARERIDQLLDPDGRYEIGSEVLPIDSLKFKDTRKYPERLSAALEETGETDALVVMQGSIKSMPLVRGGVRVRFHGRLDGLGGRRALRARRARRLRESHAVRLHSPRAAARACRKASSRCCRWRRRPRCCRSCPRRGCRSCRC